MFIMKVLFDVSDSNLKANVEKFKNVIVSRLSVTLLVLVDLNRNFINEGGFSNTLTSVSVDMESTK